MILEADERGPAEVRAVDDDVADETPRRRAGMLRGEIQQAQSDEVGARAGPVVVSKQLISAAHRQDDRPRCSGLMQGGTFHDAQVVVGFGNNGEDHTEGAVGGTVYGTYLHGPLLPKNPRFADHLIQTALRRRYEPVDLAPLDDALEARAHDAAVMRSGAR